MDNGYLELLFTELALIQTDLVSLHLDLIRVQRSEFFFFETQSLSKRTTTTTLIRKCPP